MAQYCDQLEGESFEEYLRRIRREALDKLAEEQEQIRADARKRMPVGNGNRVGRFGSRFEQSEAEYNGGYTE